MLRADEISMPSNPHPIQVKHDPRPQPLPPRTRLEDMLGRDFTHFLLDVLSDSHQGRRGSSSP